MVTLARMRMVVDDTCEYVSRYDTDGRTNIASKILKAATQERRRPTVYRSPRRALEAVDDVAIVTRGQGELPDHSS